MSDRLQEIRARLDAATGQDALAGHHRLCNGTWVHYSLLAHAPADIAWLLDEVERLRNTSLSAANPLCDGGDA